MRTWVIYICALFAFGSVLSLPQKFDKEYEISPDQSDVEIHEIRVNSHINDHFKRTDIKFELRNHQNTQYEFQFSILLPKNDSIIDEMKLRVKKGHGRVRLDTIPVYDTVILNRRQYRDLVAKQIPVALVEKDPKDPERYNLLVNLPANTEGTVEVFTSEILPLKDNQFTVVTKFETNLEVKRLHYAIIIRESKGIKRVTTNGPKTEGSKNDLDTLRNARVIRINQHMVVVDFMPTEDQIRQIIGGLDEKEGASRKVDFVVQYQLDGTADSHYRIMDQPDYSSSRSRSRRQMTMQPMDFPHYLYSQNNYYNTYGYPLRGLIRSPLQKIQAINQLNLERETPSLLIRLKTLGVVSSLTSLLVAQPST